MRSLEKMIKIQNSTSFQKQGFNNYSMGYVLFKKGSI
jgi:hypothetical protein